MIDVSIIITARNYARYLRQSIDSALRQQHHSFEVVVIDDGSTDETPEVLKRYAGRIKTVRLEGVGLARACNIGIRESVGKYIIRLDADDFFDEHILLVESNVLDRDSNIHMVYPDYYQVNADGEIVDLVRLPKVYDEMKLLDINPLAAGAMYRRESYEALGGYDEELRQQEDYDFWLRFTKRFNVFNVNLPLMYYRRHNISMSTNTAGKFDARRRVKTKFVESQQTPDVTVLGVVPAMARQLNGAKMPLVDLGGRLLLDYPILALRGVPQVKRVVVSTEDAEVAEAAKAAGAEVPYLRPAHLARPGVSVESVVQHLLQTLAREDGFRPDIVAIAHVHSPFLKSKHVLEAVQSMMIYDTDSVITVTKDITFHWRRGEHGLTPVGYQKRLLRAEKDVIFKETSALYMVRADLALQQDFIGQKVGHVEMLASESIRIDTDHDFFVAQQMIANGRNQ